MSSYWPWWAGAIALALVTVGYALATDRSFGVSGAWDRVLHWGRERETERARKEDEVYQRSLVEALSASSGGRDRLPSRTAPSTAAPPPAVAPPRRPAPLVTQAALLVSILAGGFLAAVTAGRFELRFDMGAGFAEIVTGNPLVMVLVLFAGGLLVGFGTRLAGGCSSGHGLFGCGRLQPVSILATAVFFGTAVLVSFLLWTVI